MFNDRSSSIPEAGAWSTCKEVTDMPQHHPGLVTAVCSWGDSSEQLEASETQKVAWVWFILFILSLMKTVARTTFSPRLSSDH